MFINPRGECVSRDARIANLREKRTSFASLAHEPKEEMIRMYRAGHLDPSGQPVATACEPDDANFQA